MNKKQVTRIVIETEGPQMGSTFIINVILREIGDIFYSVTIKEIKAEIVDDKP